MDWALLKQPNLCEENVILWRVTWIRDICDSVLCPVEFIFITSQEFKIKYKTTKDIHSIDGRLFVALVIIYQLPIHPLLSVYSAVVLCMLISIYTWFNDLNNSPEVIRHLKDIIPQWYIAAALTLKLCECCIKDVQNPHCTHVWVCAQCSDVWWTPAILIEIYHRENKTLYWQPQAHHVLVFFRIQ